MKVFHTADWHIGQLFYEFDRTYEHQALSGGESFLVSLALVLRLASLSRMQVESLFIDEGFGSLTPNTLNIAMDAP